MEFVFSWSSSCGQFHIRLTKKLSRAAEIPKARERNGNGGES